MPRPIWERHSQSNRDFDPYAPGSKINFTFDPATQTWIPKDTPLRRFSSDVPTCRGLKLIITAGPHGLTIVPKNKP